MPSDSTVDNSKLFEAKDIILKSVKIIQDTFNEYNENVKTTISKILENQLNNLFSNLKVDIETDNVKKTFDEIFEKYMNDFSNKEESFKLILSDYINSFLLEFKSNINLESFSKSFDSIWSENINNFISNLKIYLDDNVVRNVFEKLLDVYSDEIISNLKISVDEKLLENAFNKTWEIYINKISENINNLQNVFTKSLENNLSNLIANLKVYIETVAPQDNSHNTYNITPIHKESLQNMSNQLVRLARESVDIIQKQNAVLSEIKELLKEPTAQNITYNSINTPQQTTNEKNGNNYISKAGKSVINDLWSSVSSWN